MQALGIPVGGSFLALNNPNLRLDPYQAHNFLVELEGLLVGGFSEVSGLESEIEVESYREGGVNDYERQLPRQTTYSKLTLSHGLTAISTLWNWYYNTSRGVIERKNGTILLLDQQQHPVMWWNFRNALPVKWSGPQFQADSDAVAIESIELIHEGLSKPLLSQGLALGLSAGRR